MVFMQVVSLLFTVNLRKIFLKPRFSIVLTVSSSIVNVPYGVSSNSNFVRIKVFNIGER